MMAQAQDAVLRAKVALFKTTCMWCLTWSFQQSLCRSFMVLVSSSYALVTLNYNILLYPNSLHTYIYIHIYIYYYIYNIKIIYIMIYILDICTSVWHDSMQAWTSGRSTLFTTMTWGFWATWRWHFFSAPEFQKCWEKHGVVGDLILKSTQKTGRSWRKEY